MTSVAELVLVAVAAAGTPTEVAGALQARWGGPHLRLTLDLC